MNRYPWMTRGVPSRAGRAGAAIDLLLDHARTASKLARSVEGLEAALLEFAAAPEATHLLPSTLTVAERVDRLRAELVGEIVRAARLVLELEQPRVPQRVRS